MERLEPRPNLPRPRQVAEPARVPRRFGVGTLLLLVTLYGLLFSLLRAAGAPAMTYLSVAGFLTVIALGQMLLFGGKKPRLASFLTGGTCGCALALGEAIVLLLRREFYPVPWMLPAVAWGFAVGGLLGYATGCLLAGVFLLLKPFQKREPETAGDSPFATGDVDNDTTGQDPE